MGDVEAEGPRKEECGRRGRKTASRRQGEGVQRLGAGSSRVLLTARSHHPHGDPALQSWDRGQSVKLKLGSLQSHGLCIPVGMHSPTR